MTADERANEVMDKFGWGHGDLPGRKFAHETIAAAIRAAVLAEREAYIASIQERAEYLHHHGKHDMAQGCYMAADRVRARGGAMTTEEQLQRILACCSHVRMGSTPDEICDRVIRAHDEIIALRDETDRLRASLRTIQSWDCLNPPDAALCADFPWLRQLVDDALLGAP